MTRASRARKGLAWVQLISPNQVLTHAARAAAAKQLNKVPFQAPPQWPRAARAKGSG